MRKILLCNVCVYYVKNEQFGEFWSENKISWKNSSPNKKSEIPKKLKKSKNLSKTTKIQKSVNPIM